MHVGRIEDGIEVLRTQFLHDRYRSFFHGAPVGMERWNIDPGAEVEHLLRGHARAEVAPRHTEPRAPIFAIKDLLAIGDEAIDPYIFHPRHMPDEPGEGVHPWAGRSPDLLVG